MLHLRLATSKSDRKSFLKALYKKKGKNRAKKSLRKLSGQQSFDALWARN
jgi:hypothetical protein